MKTSKRLIYLIDKSFQLNFIGKYLVIIILTVLFCFGLAALYYYQLSILGANKLDQNIEIKSRSYITSQGYPIFKYDTEEIDVYLIKKQNKKEYFCLNPYSNPNYQIDDPVLNVDESALNPTYTTNIKVTKMFYVVIFPILWTSLFILCSIATYTIFFSHRIAGPIYRIRISLDRMLAGDFDFKIQVRKKDFFIPIVEKLEQLRLNIKNKNISHSQRSKIENIIKSVDKNREKEKIIEQLNDLLK
ncbi:MAG: hypothetical protein MJB14_03660 [Spirochaetes bacterium]|nr:hypothetical protein [Spirochaetota bacterium]